MFKGKPHLTGRLKQRAVEAERSRQSSKSKSSKSAATGMSKPNSRTASAYKAPATGMR